METLPVEINCQIFSNLTDPYDIINLIRSSGYLADIAKDCVIRLAWKEISDQSITTTFLMNFRNIREVDIGVAIREPTELIELTRLHKLHSIIIELPELNYFSDYGNLFERGATIDLIENFYNELDVSLKDKEFLFISPDTSYYLLIKDKGLFFYLGENGRYSTLNGLMKAIDATEGLTTISYYNETNDAIIQIIGRLLPRLKNLDYHDFSTIKINAQLRLMSVDTVLLNKDRWNLTDIRLITANFNLVISEPERYGQQSIDKKVRLELPVNIELVSALMMLYPNIEQLGIFLENFSIDAILTISRLIDEGIHVIIYTARGQIPGPLFNNPNILIRYID